MGDDEVPPVHHNYIENLMEEIEGILGDAVSFVEIYQDESGWKGRVYRFGLLVIEVADEIVNKVITAIKCRYSATVERVVVDRSLATIEIS